MTCRKYSKMLSTWTKYQFQRQSITWNTILAPSTRERVASCSKNDVLAQCHRPHDNLGLTDTAEKSRSVYGISGIRGRSLWFLLGEWRQGFDEGPEMIISLLPDARHFSCHRLSPLPTPVGESLWRRFPRDTEQLHVSTRPGSGRSGAGRSPRRGGSHASDLGLT